jgi:hypothetical protein
MLLEKMSMHTEIMFVHWYKIIITCSFSVFVVNCILLPKSINELNIVEILLQSAFFSATKM